VKKEIRVLALLSPDRFIASAVDFLMANGVSRGKIGCFQYQQQQGKIDMENRQLRELGKYLIDRYQWQIA